MHRRGLACQFFSRVPQSSWKSDGSGASASLRGFGFKGPRRASLAAARYAPTRSHSGGSHSLRRAEGRGGVCARTSRVLRRQRGQHFSVVARNGAQLLFLATNDEAGAEETAHLLQLGDGVRQFCGGAPHRSLSRGGGHHQPVRPHQVRGRGDARGLDQSNAKEFGTCEAVSCGRHCKGRRRRGWRRRRRLGRCYPKILQSGRRPPVGAHRRRPLRPPKQPHALRGTGGGGAARGVERVWRRLRHARWHGGPRLHSRDGSRGGPRGRTETTPEQEQEHNPFHVELPSLQPRVGPRLQRPRHGGSDEGGLRV
mmetsp:Transcript_87238/g.169013  ORF Transcript_87238/g.169013 Transcript_87238/m.169013 type:complete len:311 (+) Transcript_87238:200-1132(+)